ncbi:hypothetical protein Q3G72_010277 [Acer saccharum]|nr:hypothetical protein Q3G72_010277 [Acer saccharum]
MGFDEIAKMYAKLSLLEREGLVQRLQEVLKMVGAQHLVLSLVRKVISNKMINRDVFMGVMGCVWQVSNGVEIEFVSSNIFMFHFNNLGDCTRVLNGGLWTFDGALIALVEPTRMGDIGALTFCYLEFWVQIHQVPLLCLSKEIGWFLGSTVGEVKDVDVATSEEFLQVQVVVWTLRVDVIGDGEETVMMLCYERFPNHYFQCRHRSHPTRECSEGSDVGGYDGLEELSYGAWLRAATLERRWNRMSGLVQGSQAYKCGGFRVGKHMDFRYKEGC